MNRNAIYATNHLISFRIILFDDPQILVRTPSSKPKSIPARALSLGTRKIGTAVVFSARQDVLSRPVHLEVRIGDISSQYIASCGSGFARNTLIHVRIS